MSSKLASSLHDIKSEPLVIEATAIKLKSTSSSTDQEPIHHKKYMNSYKNGTQSLHTTPIDNDDDLSEEEAPSRLPAPMRQLAGISVSNIDLNHRRPRHSKKYKLQNNTSREAGHTPPPRSSQNKMARYSDLVRDTDKKEGPINWWNLKVKMPDDNTMNILSPHRIPVPTTPTTPEYIVKTPDGQRISLFDYIDEEEKLSKLGIQVDEEKKQYIHKLRKQQEIAAEKEKFEQKQKEKLNQQTDGNNTTSDSESTVDEYRMKEIINPSHILTVMSQPLYPEIFKTRKRSKTPHDPSTPTILTYDWDAMTNGDLPQDPYSVMEQWNNLQNDYGSFNKPTLITPQTMPAITQRFDGRISLPLYTNHMNKTTSAQSYIVHNRTMLHASQSNTQGDKSKRHSDVILRNKNMQIKRRRERKAKRRSKDDNRLKRSASVDAPDGSKTIKDRTKKNKRHSVNKGKKRRQRRKEIAFADMAKSENFASRKAPSQMVQGMPMIKLGSSRSSSRNRKVRFKNGVENENENKTVDDIIGILDVQVGSELMQGDEPQSPESPYMPPQPKEFNLKLQIKDTRSAQSHKKIAMKSLPNIVIKSDTEADTEATDIPLAVSDITINTTQHIQHIQHSPNTQSDQQDDEENTSEPAVILDYDPNQHEEPYPDDPDEEDEKSQFEDSDSGSYSSYQNYRLESSEEESFHHPPLNNPFKAAMANEESYVDEDLPQLPRMPVKDTASQPLPKIAMPAGGNRLRLTGPGVFVGADGNASVIAGGKDRKNNKHLAASPLIMQNQDVSSFFSQYIPKYYTNNPWLLSSDFHISQYPDLKNLNLFIYKKLRMLDKDINHPTQPRDIKMKQDLDWNLKIDGIATCYINEKLMTNVITYTSFPKKDLQLELLNNLSNNMNVRPSVLQLSPNTGKKKKNFKHLLGIIKSTQSYTTPNVVLSPNNTRQKMNGIGFMANSVTHTPRTSGIGVQGLNLKLQTSVLSNNSTVIASASNQLTLEVKMEEKGEGNIEEDCAYYENDDGKNSPLLIEYNGTLERGGGNGGVYGCRCRWCDCFSIHKLRSALIFGTEKNNLMNAMVYTVLYEYGDLLVFLLVYFSICVFGVCERVYFPLVPYVYEIELADVYDYVIVCSGRVMLISFIVMFLSRMVSFQSFLNEHKVLGNMCIVRVVLDNFLGYKYIHLVVGYFGLIFCSLVHVLFVLCVGIGGDDGKVFEMGDYYVFSVYHEYEYEDKIYLFDLIRVALLLLCILGLMLSNCGGTYYSHYAVSYESINDKYLNKCKSILCNESFDYGLNKKRYKWLHILSFIIYLCLFYLDLNYAGVYYILSLFVVLFVLDRLLFLNNKHKRIESTDLNVIPIDHQFKLLYVNTACNILPGDIFYICGNKQWTFSRPSIFFSKNNYHSIGCIMRVHRNNTLSNNMERVKWNFNFLEKILDNECTPIFRGPYRNNNIYNKLIRNIQTNKFGNEKYIQYLIACDEGIAYQIEYLTYLQAHGYDKKMPYPTHIIFATSSKSLFNYICTNLQLLFVEMEDLTVECKLLPSNINLIPNMKEMVNYYKNEKKKENKDVDVEIEIKEDDIMREMEYDILHYLSIPHILYHHNLKVYYENEKNSKLSQTLNRKYSFDPNKLIKNKNNKQQIQIGSNYNFNEDIQIEMYYCGIPFVSNVLNNVCKLCRIPYYTQTIY